jgi:hypothetical protein
MINYFEFYLNKVKKKKDGGIKISDKKKSLKGKSSLKNKKRFKIFKKKPKDNE